MTRLAPRPARTRRGLVLAGLVLAMFMAAIEGTIVATAMPSIAGSLGGFALYAWVFAGYLLMQAVTTPMFGKLADLIGRKPVFVAGVTVFLAGSVACGFAASMPWLIAFRLVQGLVDKASKGSTLHKNTAARKKSRLAARLRKMREGASA